MIPKFLKISTYLALLVAIFFGGRALFMPTPVETTSAEGPDPELYAQSEVVFRDWQFPAEWLEFAEYLDSRYHSWTGFYAMARLRLPVSEAEILKTLAEHPCNRTGDWCWRDAGAGVYVHKTDWLLGSDGVWHAPRPLNKDRVEFPNEVEFGVDPASRTVSYSLTYGD